MPIVLTYDDPALVAALAGSAGHYATNNRDAEEARRQAEEARRQAQFDDDRRQQEEQALRQQRIDYENQAAAANQRMAYGTQKQSAPVPQGGTGQTAGGARIYYPPGMEVPQQEADAYDQNQQLAAKQYEMQQRNDAAFQRQLELSQYTQEQQNLRHQSSLENQRQIEASRAKSSRLRGKAPQVELAELETKTAGNEISNVMSELRQLSGSAVRADRERITQLQSYLGDVQNPAPGTLRHRLNSAIEQQRNSLQSRSAGTDDQEDLPQPQTPEEAASLPPGTRFRTPDGRIKVRP